MQAEGQFKNYCADLKRFDLHFTLDKEATITEDTGDFKRCSKCNRPTIDHKKPVNSKCTLEIIDDDDDIFDIEEMLRARPEFKTAFSKLLDKIRIEDEAKEKATCDICGKYFKNENGLNTHKRVMHKEQNVARPSELKEFIDFLKDERLNERKEREERETQERLVRDSREEAERKDRDNERSTFKAFVTENNENKTPQGKIDDCPKWRKDHELESFQASALLWDDITKHINPARKLNMLLQSIQEDHPSEYSRLHFET